MGITVSTEPKGYNTPFGYKPTSYNPTGVKEFASDTEFKEMLAESMEAIKEKREQK